MGSTSRILKLQPTVNLQWVNARKMSFWGVGRTMKCVKCTYMQFWRLHIENYCARAPSNHKLYGIRLVYSDTSKCAKMYFFFGNNSVIMVWEAFCRVVYPLSLGEWALLMFMFTYKLTYKHSKVRQLLNVRYKTLF